MHKSKEFILLEKNKQIYFIGGLFLIIGILIAGILFYTGPIYIKNISDFNSYLLLKTIKLNKDIRHIKSGIGKVLYYSALKPSLSQKIHLKTALNNLEINFKRTDKQYKKLDGFIKKNNAFLKHNLKIIAYFNKSYFKWKNINKPILKIIIKYPEYISSKISYKLFLKHNLYLSYLPMANIVKDIKLYFKKLINIAMYTTIAGVIIILFLGILFIYYIDKFHKSLLIAEQKFKYFFYNLPLSSFIIDIESGRFMYANNASVKFYGYSKEELLNMSMTQINVSNNPQELKIFRSTAAVEGSGVATFKHKLKNGEIKIVQSYIAVITLDNKQCLLVIILDITENVANEKWMRTLYAAIENSPDWMMVTDSLGNIEYVNNGVENISGYKKEELIGKNPRIFKSGLYDAKVYKTFWDTINSGEVLKVILTDKRKNGELFTLDATIVPIKNKENSKIINFVSISKDITQEKRLEEEVKYISFYDSLTELPNRNLFIISINLSLSSRKYNEKKLNDYLVIIDFYKLSYINNTYGYDIGDKLLQNFSKRLNKVMKNRDIIARVGGDQFGILFVDLQNKDDILRIIERIKEEFKNPLYLDEIEKEIQNSSNHNRSKSGGGGGQKSFDLKGETLMPANSEHSESLTIASENKPNKIRSFNVSFTMGISIFPNDGKNAEDLLKSADIALLHAKEQGEGEYEFFKESMNIKASEFLLMKNNIMNAFKNKEFVIYYQPYVDIKTGKLGGMEALARWNSQDIGMIHPVKFIPILEKIGLIRQFEEFLIDTICWNLKHWEEKALNIVPVSMNISPVSFRKEGLIDMIVSALGRYEIAPSLLNIEITEGLFIQNFDYALKILNLFKEKGIKISIDDFGTGYSSLSYIKNIPADYIKIDISFIRGMIENTKDLAIVNAVVVLASKLGMKTISEGVETEEQLEILKSFGCDMIQGYLFSKPVPEDELLQFLKQP